MSTDKFLQRMQHDQLKLLVEMKQWREKLLIPEEEVRAEAEHLLHWGITIDPLNEGLAQDARHEFEVKRLQWQQLGFDDLIDLVGQVDWLSDLNFYLDSR